MIRGWLFGLGLMLSLSWTWACPGPPSNEPTHETNNPSEGGSETTTSETTRDRFDGSEPSEASTETIPDVPQEAPSESQPDHTLPDLPAPKTPKLTSPSILEPAKDKGTIRIQPSLAIGQDGQLALAWTGSNDGGKELEIYFTLLGTDGTVNNPVVQLSTYKGGSKNEPSLCALQGGGYVAAWPMDTKAGTNNLQIRFRILDASGKPLDTEDTQVKTEVDGNHWLARVTCGPDGGFLITGVRPDNDKSFGVFYWPFTKDGKPIGKAISVNTETDGGQVFPTIGVANNGNVIVAWEQTSPGTNGTYEEVAFRVFPKTGNPSKVTVMTGGPGNDAAKAAALSVDPNTGFFVVSGFLSKQNNSVLKRYNPKGQAPVVITIPDSGAGFRYNIALAPLGRPDAHAAVFFRRNGTQVSTGIAILGKPDVAQSAYTVANGPSRLLPPYRPSIAAAKGKLAAAWVERVASRQFTIKIALFE